MILVFLIAGVGCENDLEIIISNIVNPAPSGLVVMIDGMEMEPDGEYNFGPVQMASPVEVTGTVANTGQADLVFTGSSPIVRSDSSSFSVQTQPASVVAAGEQSTFTLRFLPVETGEASARLTIESNAPGAGRMNITLTGIGTDAEISVFHDTVEVAMNSSVQIGTTGKDTPLIEQFTVTNDGTGTLKLEAAPGVDGPGAEMYVVSTIEPCDLGEGESGTFTVTFTPADFGSFDAEILLSCNDRDESSFRFGVTGSATFAGERTVDTMPYTPYFSSLSLVREENELYLAYRHTDTGLKLARSTDDGNSWSLSTVDADGIDQNLGLNPSLFVDGNRAVVLYADELNANYHRLRYITSSDGGSSWTAPVFPFDSANCGRDYSACMVGDEVHVAFGDYGGGQLEHASFTWSNTAWPVDSPLMLESSLILGGLSVLGGGENVFVAYQDHDDTDLSYAYSANYGASFTKDIVIESVGSPGTSLDMCLHDGEVCLSYYEEDAGELHFARSTDVGQTWPADGVETLDTGVYIWSGTAIACDGATIYVAYFDESSDTLRLVVSDDSGVSWSPSTEIRSLTGAYNVFPDLLTYEGSLYLVYLDVTANSVKFLKSADGGVTWPE